MIIWCAYKCILFVIYHFFPQLLWATHISPKSWLTRIRDASVKSLGDFAGGSHNNTCRFVLGKDTKDWKINELINF